MLTLQLAAGLGDAMRLQCYSRVLASPDDPKLVGVLYGQPRGHRLTQTEKRPKDELWRELVQRWCTHFQMETTEERPGRARRVPRTRPWILARDGRL